MVVGILAHVDAGKTTLSEGFLYETGQIRTLGRVDHRNSYLDSDEKERERGITIFSKQAQITMEGVTITLLDTPGHVDFSAEMERTLQVLDYAILVISGTDGVQGHSKTLWKLLKHYHIPCFIFVNKMDLAGADVENIQSQLRKQLSDSCVDFSHVSSKEEYFEELAMCSEELLDSFMEKGTIAEESISRAVAQRCLFPCYYGSALKLEGVGELLQGLVRYGSTFCEQEKIEGEKEAFGAQVFKIERDDKGNRLTFMKVTRGRLHVKDKVSYQGLEEKVDQIRIYSGNKYETVDEVVQGQICAVTGLDQTAPGMGIGVNQNKVLPILEPVLNYQILVPQGVNPVDLMKKLRQLEEEDPQLNMIWNEELQEIHAQLMGQVQMEVLARVIEDRFSVKIGFGPGNIVYKETIARAVEGVGHFEPLRHYAEAHILMEPLEPGSGIVVDTKCSEDVLDLNWQRLIATHILEKEHKGVLTGSPVTDIKFTIVSGKAHMKHTEGGDFRQATYRAIRQGLKSTECVLLEPYYNFSLELPAEQLGRAMTDIRQRFGTHDAPEYISEEEADMVLLRGSVPVSTMQDYMTELYAYTKGRGLLTLELRGYDVCHNSAEVVEAMGYDSEEDQWNPTSSVFCAHGAGFIVPWNEVPQYMHLEYVCDLDGIIDHKGGLRYDLEEQAKHLQQLAKRKEEEKEAKKSSSSYALDQELQQIYAREFGMSKEDVLEYERKKWSKKQEKKEQAPTIKYDKKGNPIYPKKKLLEDFLIVDGYNIIFAWEDLKELARLNIDSAKDKLKDLLGNYQGYKKCRIMLVFDGYKVKGNKGSVERYYDLEVVHTKQDETADMYIERRVHELSSKYNITVATSDNLEQLTILSQGALRMSAISLKQELERIEKQIENEYLKK